MSDSWKIICRDPFTNFKSHKTSMLSNNNLPEKKSITVQFHFSDTSMTNYVKVIKSGVWTDQAQQNWC